MPALEAVVVERSRRRDVVADLRASGKLAAGPKRVLYAANEANNSLDVYSVSGLGLKRSGSITASVNAPRDVFVSVNHTIDVANAETVTKYPNGQSSPAVTFALPVRSVALNVGPDGTVFVCGTTVDSGRSEVVEFDPGAVASAPCLQTAAWRSSDMNSLTGIPSTASFT